MRIDILSLFPTYFQSPLNESILKKAQQRGLLEINLVDIRDFADNKHRKVDDRPYGGGPGMVMMPEPLCAAIESVKVPTAKMSSNSRYEIKEPQNGVPDDSPGQGNPHRGDAALGTGGNCCKMIYLSPQGKVLTASKCRELAQCAHLILICGHYEGIDQRVLDTEDLEEISIGDYVLMSGCAAGIVLIEAVTRFIPGVLGNEQTTQAESFEEDEKGLRLLDCPHYTRPETFRGIPVPEVLRKGNHQEIAKWRKAQAMAKTLRVRPDLLKGE